MANRTLTLHLVKEDVAEFDAILSENAVDRLRQPNTRTLEVPGFAEGAKLYVFSSENKVPDWFLDLNRAFGVQADVRTRSSCAILAFRLNGRMFATTFAHGWMYLNESNIEGDFGLRVAINALDEKKLKRLERANLGDALRGVSLSPFQREFTSFGQDDALDLVRRIGGATREEASADAMSGSRSLKVSGELEIEGLPEIAAEALEFYRSVAYQQTSFKIIDSVMPITDLRTSKELDELAVESIRNGEEFFELGLPVGYDDDGMAYRFQGPRLRWRHPDLLLRHYVAALGENLATITVETLKDHKVVAVKEDGTGHELKWSIHNALVGSISYDNGLYATNEGEWYRVDEQFKQSIEAVFSDLRQEWETPPTPLRKRFDERGRNGSYQDEESYNLDVARATGFIPLDRKLITIPDVPRPDFEACDLLDIAGKRFIHVKKNSRKSSVLSHFFKQGSNAAQLFGRFRIWDQLVNKVREVADDEAAQGLREVINDVARPWTVEFWIADAPRTNGTFNIPFFSKISLRDEVTTLRAMSYRVAIRFIGLDPGQIGQDQ
jgi:uncharacterized protein (TIGR04141 family)